MNWYETSQYVLLIAQCIYIVTAIGAIIYMTWGFWKK